jgi:hypothetical protein
MEKVVLTFNVGQPFFCPFCGIQTIPEYDENKQTNFKVCEHLLYIGSGEGGFEIIGESIKEKIRDDMDEDELFELGIENAVHFSFCEPSPSSFSSFVGYKFEI